MKRSYSEQSDLAEEASSSSMFHLKSQNRALSLEMLRYKRQLSGARKELDMIRGKSREMESLVSIIQRAWSQLDIDASMLLDGFGDSEHIAEAGGNSELLYRLVHAGSNFHSLDPTDVNGLPKLGVDEWSTAEDLAKARELAERKLNGETTGMGVGKEEKGGGGGGKIMKRCDEEGKSSNDLDMKFGGKVDETLCAHASFTLTLLERLCFVLSDSGILDHLPGSLGAISDAKALHAEIFVLKDRIVKLSSEIIDNKAQLHVYEKQKIFAEKTLDRAVIEHSRQLAIGVINQNQEKNSEGENIGPSDSRNDISGGDMKELCLKISVLEKQLGESEGAKARAEMTLTERLARPLSQTEAQVVDIRRAMEDLRQQGRQRVASLILEGSALQERVSDLETAMMLLESSSEEKCLEVATAAAQQIRNIELEKEALHSTLFASQADVAITNQLKLQIGELTVLESSARLECQKLQQKIASLVGSHDRLQMHLNASREREYGYEIRLGLEQQQQLEKEKEKEKGKENNSNFGHNLNLNNRTENLNSLNNYNKEMEVSDDLDGGPKRCSFSPGDDSTYGNHIVTSEIDSSLITDSEQIKSLGQESGIKTNFGKVEKVEELKGQSKDINEGETKIVVENITSIPLSLSASLLTLKQVQERAKETQIELDDARGSLNDLILEIESVSVEEGRSREQSARVLRQMADSQAMQRGVMEENLRLHEKIEELQTKYNEVESRVEILQNVMKQQDSIINQLRIAEQAARTDVRCMKRTEADEGSKKHLNEQLLVEVEQRLKLADHTVVTAKKRNAELQDRCDELSTQWEAERKLRMEAQRESKQKTVKKEKNGNDNDKSAGNSGHLNHEDAAMLEMTLGMLRCSVCKDRFKEVALTRCFHLFCKECIDENLRNRQRKCPACGEKFGQDDVKSIFFTD